MTENVIDLEQAIVTVVSCFPKLEPQEKLLSLELYRLLAHGEPVPRDELAGRLDMPLETVDAILDGWPAVFCDDDRRIIGYWGLATTLYRSPHRFTTNGQAMSAWCAWDTLFLPELLGRTAEVESVCPATQLPVRLQVSPRRVERVEPAETVLSFTVPEENAGRENVVTSLCRFLHFFTSPEAGRAWVAEHPGTFLVSLDDGFWLGKRKNAIQYGTLLAERRSLTDPGRA